ncbi:MAG: hypothetical protein AAF903_12475 [Pseudomonadota bacterium]
MSVRLDKLLPVATDELYARLLLLGKSHWGMPTLVMGIIVDENGWKMLLNKFYNHHDLSVI